MKKMNQFCLFLVLLFSSCITEEQIVDLNQNSESWTIPQEVVEINNFNNSGINFILAPKKTDSEKPCTKTPFFSKTVDASTMYLFDLITQYPGSIDSVKTVIMIEQYDSGMVVLSHLTEEGIPFATLTYDDGKLLTVDLPVESDSISYGANGYPFKSKNSLSTFYKCVNKEYQRIKKVIESDMVNDITCDITFIICRPLMVMTAVENCR
jgi:hypothetical protein